MQTDLSHTEMVTHHFEADFLGASCGKKRGTGIDILV
jgi:hypothetical protein